MDDAREARGRASRAAGVALPILAGLVVAIASTFPFALHLDSLPGGRLGDAGQRAFWLPWQIYANVVSGRGLDDSSGFLAAPDAGLFALVGNPAIALFLAPLHALGNPTLAHGLGLLLLLASNGAAAWTLGRTLAPRPRPALAALAFGASGWLAAQAADGALSAAWLAPGLAAAAAARSGSRGGFAAALALGLVGAPLPTAAILLAEPLLGLPRTARLPLGQAPPLPRAPLDRGLVLAAVVAGTLVAIALPSALAGDPVRVPPNILAWPASGTAVGLPLAFALGIGAAWRAGARPSAVAVLLCALAAVGPFARDASGDLVRLDTFALPIGFDLPLAAAHGAELLSGALAAALLAALGWLARARLGGLGTVAIGAALLLEPRLQAALGQGTALSTGVAWPAPAALRALASAPYSGAILELPLTDVREGLVGLVPFHRQAISSGPAAGRSGPIQDGLRALAWRTPALRSLSSAPTGEQGVGGDLGPALQAAGYTQVLVAGDQPELRISVQRLLGQPRYEDEDFALWDTVHEDAGAPGGPGGGPDRPPGPDRPKGPGAQPGAGFQGMPGAPPTPPAPSGGPP